MKEKDRSHLRLITKPAQMNDEGTIVDNEKYKTASSSIREKLEWRGLTIKDIFLPVLTLGFLIGVSVFFIFGLIKSIQ